MVDSSCGMRPTLPKLARWPKYAKSVPRFIQEHARRVLSDTLTFRCTLHRRARVSRARRTSGELWGRRKTSPDVAPGCLPKVLGLSPSLRPPFLRAVHLL